ncbi:MAG TPA: hypothetical protein VIR30_14315 [Nocardioides sp.]
MRRLMVILIGILLAGAVTACTDEEPAVSSNEPAPVAELSIHGLVRAVSGPGVPVRSEANEIVQAPADEGGW